MMRNVWEYFSLGFLLTSVLCLPFALYIVFNKGIIWIDPFAASTAAIIVSAITGIIAGAFCAVLGVLMEYYKL